MFVKGSRDTQSYITNCLDLDTVENLFWKDPKENFIFFGFGSFRFDCLENFRLLINSVLAPETFILTSIGDGLTIK